MTKDNDLYLAEEGKEKDAVRLTKGGTRGLRLHPLLRLGGGGGGGGAVRRATPRRRGARRLVEGLEVLLRHQARRPQRQGAVRHQLADQPAADAGEVQVPDARRGGDPQERAARLRRATARRSIAGRPEVEGRDVQQHPLGQGARRAALHPPRPAPRATSSCARSTSATGKRPRACCRRGVRGRVPGYAGTRATSKRPTR